MASPDHNAVVVELRRDNWDDYHFKTFFHVRLLIDFQHTVDLGTVKILRAGMTEGQTPLPPSPFPRLDSSYCTLGQETSYYEMVRALDPELRQQYLLATRDAVADPAIESSFEQEPGWRTSLLRFGQAEHALAAGRAILSNQPVRRPGALSFRTQMPFGHQDDDPIDFQFGIDGGVLPGRCNVLIGYNGVGKTRLLARLALAASAGGTPPVDPKGDRPARITGTDSTFGAVVTVSYSAFDTFDVPDERLDPANSLLPPDGARTEFHGWTYCGLRLLMRGDAPESLDRLKSPQNVEEEFLRALDEARQKHNGEPLRRALSVLASEPSFGRIGVSPPEWIHLTPRAQTEISQLSTGHKIVSNIVVQLASHLQNRSLVLIDEPESHLHPPLLATLLKAVHGLLDDYDSFSIIATHSPVVLQEIPSRYVKVLDRVEDRTVVRSPDIEVFGENIGAITRYVFSLDNSISDYQGAIASLAGAMSLEQMEELFPEHGMSSQARALALNAQHSAR
jgi:predicted ATPase